MARREEIALRVVRGLVRRPRLADAVFRFDRWGNILGPDRFVDPYPIYERMRESGPVSFSPLLQQWAVVGYEEAREVLRSPSFGVAGQMELVLDSRPYSELSDQTRTLFRNALLFTDPPLHTRLRAAVSRAFTPRQMQRLEPRVQAIVTRLLKEIADEPRPELMTSIAEPLPIQVIAELIGVPEDRWTWVTKISTLLRRVVDPFVPLDPAEVDRTFTELATYYNSLTDERAAHPTGDLLTELARSESDGQINRTELLSLLTILFLAGHETTTGAIGNALVALGRHPEQRDLLRDRPDLWPNAVEELLRYDTVLQTDPRQALENITIADQTIRAGQNVTIMLGAANRDPTRFTDPDRLRVDRNDPSPISFGHGIHHCVGAALARLELRNALPAIIDTLRDYTIDETQLEWKTSLAFRSPARLPIQLPPSPAKRALQRQ
jgi:cytochrome P450